ncbi:MAG TPA: hypothetical protein VNI84_12420 [Pyrinomonadaceae bacterium]|nr:hypothetical protein [Pyrinomonadaceae bacterium]
MSKKAKTVQEELELRRENKQDIHEWIHKQSGQPADIHEWIKTQNQTKQKGEKTNE